MIQTGTLRGGGAAVIALLLAASLTVPTAVAGVGTPDDGAHDFVSRIDIGDGRRTCTGALVHAEWILTAASCLVEDPATGQPAASGPPAERITVTVGRADLTTTTGQLRQGFYVVHHEDRDLAMVKLDAPVTTIATPRVAAATPVPGEELIVPGYGRTATEWSPLRRHAGAFQVDGVIGHDVATTGLDGAAVCAGDAGAPVLRETDGGIEVAAVSSRSWQGGCFGADPAETRTGAVGTRLDDIGAWVDSMAVDARYSNLVRAVYEDSLGRTAWPEEIAQWEHEVAADGPARLATVMETSSKYRRARIVAAYRGLLGYTPTSDQIATQMDYLLSGERTIDEVDMRIMATTPYFNRAGGTNADYIRALYRDMLNSTPSADQIATWSERVETLGRDAVVASIWNGGRATGFRVTTAFRHYLGSDPSSTQLTDWVERLASSDRSDEELRHTILTSVKYAERAATRY